MGWLESILQRILHECGGSRRFLNEKLIEHLASATKPRPHPFSLWGPTRPSEAAPVHNPAPASEPNSPPSPSAPSSYTSWPGLFDRTFTARHLPPCTDGRSYPEIDKVLGLLTRKAR